jgi:hypothetical protein
MIRCFYHKAEIVNFFSVGVCFLSRRLQKELAFTPAKNTTKPSPFKIISLQPTRKENNWETEETMERADCNSGDGTGQMAQPWVFMMMMKIMEQSLPIRPSVRTNNSAPNGRIFMKFDI